MPGRNRLRASRLHGPQLQRSSDGPRYLLGTHKHQQVRLSFIADAYFKNCNVLAPSTQGKPETQLCWERLTVTG